MKLSSRRGRYILVELENEMVGARVVTQVVGTFTFLIICNIEKPRLLETTREGIERYRIIGWYRKWEVYTSRP